MTLQLTRRQLLVLSATAVLPVSGLYSSDSAAGKPVIYTDRFSNLALSGYDCVAYFNQSTATKGDKALTEKYLGARWAFSSQQNLDEFKADPDAYIPQYGGYCAFSVAKNKLFKGDPKIWVVENGKLYVNFNKGLHRLWLARSEEMIDKADANWPDILG